MIDPNWFAAALALAITATPLKAGEAAAVAWSQLLDPSAQQFEDPCRGLAPGQMSELMSLVRLREELGSDTLPVEQRGNLEARATELEAALQAGGVDVDWLLAQRWVVADRRRRAAVAVNRAFDGQQVELTGFLVPAPPMDDGGTTAYLLPDRGVCNHLPPSPPNQLVRLELASMPDLGGFCVPAVVRGTLRAEESRHQAFVIDDAVPMWSAWTLETDGVRYYE
jgi:hypothetical protein